MFRPFSSFLPIKARTIEKKGPWETASPQKKKKKERHFPDSCAELTEKKKRKEIGARQRSHLLKSSSLFSLPFLCLPSTVVKKGPSCSAVVVWLSIPPLLCSDAISPSPPPRIIRGVRKRGKNGGSGERGETFIVMIRRLLPLARDSAL